MHQDYVLRMIQQMSQFITRVLRLREDGDDEQALIEITEAYGRMTGMHASLVHGLSEDDLVALLTTQGQMHPERLISMAILLREEASIYSDREEINEALPRSQKALRLYLEGREHSDALRYERIPGLDETIAWMEGYPITPGTRTLLIDYLEEMGRFDEAENHVIEWVEDGSDVSNLAAKAFYTRLLQLEDAELIVGGLNREEVEMGLDSLN